MSIVRTDRTAPRMLNALDLADGIVRHGGIHLFALTKRTASDPLDFAAELITEILEAAGVDVSGRAWRAWPEPELICDLPDWWKQSEGFVDDDGARVQIHLRKEFSVWTLADLLAESILPDRTDDDPQRIELIAGLVETMVGATAATAFRSAATSCGLLRVSGGDGDT